MISSAARALPIAIVFLASPPRSAAQASAWIDGAGTRVAYSGVPGASALSVSPTLQVTRPLAWFAATGAFSQLEADWSLQGTASGALFSSRFSGFQLEGGGLASGSTHDDGTSTSALRGRARLHWTRGAAGVWAGGQLGTAWNSVRRQSTRLGDVGAWVRAAPFTLVVSAMPTWIGDSLRFVDGDATVRLVRGSVELAAFAGLRHWREPEGLSTDAWGGASAAVWLSPHLAIVGGGGSYLADYGQGFPGGSYVTLGIRVATRRPAEAEPVSERLRRLPLTLPRSVVPAFEVRTVAGNRRVLRLQAPQARRVELMGEFTDWKPVALRRSGGSDWTATLTVAPGTYRMNVRIDGGAWAVPPGVTALEDDFGVVGILRIE
ncbi:MAG: glycogen-binding domain-containing protein [Gemmatimonadales bacterium]